jgi:DNA-binding response OmpR family regulator
MDKLRVLLVDDEKDFVQALAERLELRGLEISLAFDGEQALRLVSELHPQVMVLDLKMPGMDGMEVLRRIARSHPEIRIIMLTGHGSGLDRDEALRLGAHTYLQKPVQIDQLMQAIR